MKSNVRSNCRNISALFSYTILFRPAVQAPQSFCIWIICRIICSCLTLVTGKGLFSSVCPGHLSPIVTSHMCGKELWFILKKWLLLILFNVLPGNSSVNTVQHATIDEAVFSMSSAQSSGGNGVMWPVSKQRVGKHFRVSGDIINNRDGVFRWVCAERL
jgi:hypothetical protein